MDSVLAVEPSTRSYICHNVRQGCVRALTGGRFFKFDCGEGICDSCGLPGIPEGAEPDGTYLARY